MLFEAATVNSTTLNMACNIRILNQGDNDVGSTHSTHGLYGYKTCMKKITQRK
jgi:hypothetical protein